MDDRQMLGSQTARAGFQNERDVVACFNSWRTHPVVQEWLRILGYALAEIESVKTVQISGHKADVQAQVTISIKLKQIIEVQNIQVKLVSNPKGYNQVDKRWVDTYQELWKIPSVIASLLKYYTGEFAPNISYPRDKRRMFVDEFSARDQKLLLTWFNENRLLIISDIFKGRGQLAAEWMLIIQKGFQSKNWALLPMNVVMNYYNKGEVKISPRGSIKIGGITVQRKGGDGGRSTAQMLQFKINPAELLELGDGANH